MDPVGHAHKRGFQLFCTVRELSVCREQLETAPSCLGIGLPIVKPMSYFPFVISHCPATAMFHVCFYLRHLDDENMVCILPTQTVLWQPYMLGYVIDADGATLVC